MFFKESKNKTENEDLAKVAALLIHAAKIDENYSDQEKEIIKKTLLQIGAKIENKEIKMTPEMLNLLGCSKENFKKLLKGMNYKIINRENEIYFKYIPKKNLKRQNKKTSKESPFEVLKSLNFN